MYHDLFNMMFRNNDNNGLNEQILYFINKQTDDNEMYHVSYNKYSVNYKSATWSELENNCFIRPLVSQFLESYNNYSYNKIIDVLGTLNLFKEILLEWDNVPFHAISQIDYIKLKILDMLHELAKNLLDRDGFVFCTFKDNPNKIQNQLEERMAFIRSPLYHGSKDKISLIYQFFNELDDVVVTDLKDGKFIQKLYDYEKNFNKPTENDWEKVQEAFYNIMRSSLESQESTLGYYINTFIPLLKNIYANYAADILEYIRANSISQNSFFKILRSKFDVDSIRRLQESKLTPTQWHKENIQIMSEFINR